MECKLHQYYFLLLPVALFLSSLMIKYLAPDAEGRTEKVIEAVHKRWGKINWLWFRVKTGGDDLLPIAGGGSAGREGPSAEMRGRNGFGACGVTRFNQGRPEKVD